MRSSIIRKITIGSSPKEEGIAFQIGKRAGNDDFKISKIIEDTNNFFSFGAVRYLVFISDLNNKNEYLWKAFENVPIIIEYYLPTEDYIKIV